MKVLTLHQPWASLVIDDVKRIETRSWGTSHRGTLMIHAGKTVDYGFCEELGIDPALLPTGAILGTVQLINCAVMTPRSLRQFSDAEKRYGLFRVGRFAWHLHSPKKFGVPILERGWQQLWNWEVPLPEAEQSIVPRPSAEADDALGTPRAWREEHHD